MIKTFTQNDLVQYLYNELPTQQRQHLEHAMLADHDLAESCADLLLTQCHLAEAYVQPHRRATDAIIRYSKSVSSPL
ncbi:hypothetical protein [Rufibacter sp. LB8]|uniref:hypothetical protein n=1 Tax=Rufibacter sp. LB8 TaxID=2777781 RepID=UPI00178C79E3|nr:hypothetical protein [Rufibacter sp. LB8]